MEGKKFTIANKLNPTEEERKLQELDTKREKEIKESVENDRRLNEKLIRAMLKIEEA